MVLKISLIFVVFFVILQNFSSFAQFCGGKSLASLNKVQKYKPAGGGQPLDLRRAAKNSFAGNFGKVFIGYVKQNKRQSQMSQSANSIICVAIKKYEENEYIEFENSRNFMQRLQSVISPENRKHLITMIDAGDLRDRKGGVIIMELGVESIENRIYSQRQEYENDSNLFEEIKKIAQPLKEMHKVAIHGDVKLKNLIFVNETDGTESVKLIDFDGSVLIPVRFWESSKKLANKIVPHQNIIFSPAYTPPEYYADKTVTTKMDIWALGIIVYEIILLQKRFNAKISKQKMIQILLKIGNVYMGIKRDKNGNKRSEESLHDKSSWVRNNYKTLMTILQVWQRYPKTGLLLANILHPNIEMRMSAIGVQQFLNASCLTAELKTVERVGELNFVGPFTFNAFCGLVLDKKNAFCATCTFAVPIYDALLEKVDKVLYKLQRTVDEMKSGWFANLRLGTCDTERSR